MSPEEMAAWVAATYDLPLPIECRLLRSYTNDVYTVRCADGRFALKVYGEGWRTELEVRWEIALLRHLAARGAPIAAPVPGRGGDDLPSLSGRYSVLFEYAPGEKPTPPFLPSLYVEFGRAIARVHELSADFVALGRRPLDLSLLVEEPLTRVAPLLTRQEDRDFLQALADRVKARMAALAGEGLDRGPVHGDASLDNLHVADGKVILYDFDSGGTGWRAMDLQGWAAGRAEYRERWAAFQRGYSSIRPMRRADLEAAPLLTIATDIWGIGIDLDRRILPRGTVQAREWLRDRIALLREHA